MRLIIEDHFTARRRRKLRWQQLALWLALTILVIQLIGMAFHNHSLAEQSSDCISCDLAADFPAPVPTVPVPVLTPVLVFAYHAAVELVYAFVPAPHNYLTPHSQAPPATAAV
ncbi:hypothetical protein CAter282_2858 [Collimonas arenae]|uniref:DUF2946 domain-containing protein n=1 Tax=Collimonas arenae TaxID=279058 RepID=A0A127PSH3_9BURK|nr:hypothetical protein [Collimonas arenae]AMP00694.1 hypothetical protein CAter10_3149 [Collimonas arenae]AMP10582.1 hypothetical protein CAter282_2858 [Collimonas arenae]